MIKKFDEYIKENYSDYISEEDYIAGNYWPEDIETIDDLDGQRLNSIPSLYKERYRAMIEYDIIVPDKGEETEEIVRKIVTDEMRKMSNQEVTIDAVHKVQKRF